MSDHHKTNYVKIWGILLVLLVVSVLGPMLEIPVLTLITAFGIAIVKAYLVARNFMHLNIEKRFVTYILVTMVVLMVLMVGGVAPDVMKHDGQRWENTAAKAAVKRGQAAQAQADQAKAH
jgi:caa(3)-type oxidase subunit IV